MIDQSNFDEYITEWGKLVGEERASYYERTLWSEVRQRFMQRANRLTYEVLIVPVSNQHTALLNIERYRPQIAVFIYSQQSRTAHQDSIHRAVMAMGVDYEETNPDINAQDPLDVYRAVKQVYERHNGKRIAVDITGGTKVMSVGVAMAGSLIGADSIYIESKFEPALRDRLPGSEVPHRLPDPYTTLGDIQRARARAFFTGHDYVTAEQLFAELARRVEPPQDDAFWADLAHSYALWEGFDLAAAEQSLQDMLNVHTASRPEQHELIKAHLQAIRRVRPLVEQHGPQRDDLATWRGERTFAGAIRRFVPQQIRRLTTDHVASTLLAMLYTNALRRAKQERHDTAALLLYRCLELMSQQRLARKGVLTEFARDGLDILRRNIPNLEQRCTDVLHTVRPEGRMELPYYKSKLALFEGYVLLQAVDDAFGQRCDLAQIEDQTSTRNQSILAHGFSFISSGAYNSFKVTVDTVINHWCDEEKLVWSNYCAMCTFAIPPL